MLTRNKKSFSTSNFKQNPQINEFNSSKKVFMKSLKQQKFKNIESLPKISSKLQGLSPQLSDIRKDKKSQAKQLALAIQRYKIHRDAIKKEQNQSNDIENDLIINNNDKGDPKSLYKHNKKTKKDKKNQIYLDLLQILKQFSLTQNNFQQLFQHIFKDTQILMCYTGDNIQFQSKYNVSQGDLYKKICENMDIIFSKKFKQYQINNIKLKQQFNELKKINSNMIFSFNAKQQQYKKQIQKLTKMINKQYITYLQQNVQQLNNTIQQYKYSQKNLLDQKQLLEKQNMKKKEFINDQLKQINILRKISDQFKNTKKQFQKLLIQLKDRFDQLNIKMIKMKNVIQNVEKENQLLKTQRFQLMKRAAVNFQQLTPRPNYKKHFNFNQIQNNKKLKSTVQITSIIFQKIGNQLYKNKQLRQSFLDKKQIKYHQKLQQIQKMRQETIHDIEQSKFQLNEIQKTFFLQEY